LQYIAAVSIWSGLPDFSSYMIPKPEKMYQMNSKCTYQMVFKYPKSSYDIPSGHKIYKRFPIWGPPKFTQNWDFWVENKPSGNPVFDEEKRLIQKKNISGAKFPFHFHFHSLKNWVDIVQISTNRHSVTFRADLLVVWANKVSLADARTACTFSRSL
jgi:hypothetical protein